MCGIVGAIANRDITNVIVRGLQALEYRGYDSAGIAVTGKQTQWVRKAAGKLKNLQHQLADRPLHGRCGIGHTRWATHGLPNEHNAHPQVSHDSIAVVHNGIIENNHELRDFLTNQYYNFISDTDTETIAHLVHYYMTQGYGFSQAARQAIMRLDGEYALAITCVDEPGKIIAAREGSPLVIGVGSDEFFVASDTPALLSETQDFIFLEEGDIAEITSKDCRIYDCVGNAAKRIIQHLDKHNHEIDKGDYAHFMIKEIHEQPAAVQATLDAHANLLDFTNPDSALPFINAVEGVSQIHLVACGTSWHAAYIAKYWLEKYAKLACQVEIASEYIHRQPVVPEGTLFIAISQSGETADTLAAIRHAKKLGYINVLGICNNASSSLSRESDMTLLTHAGIEIGVASTKAFTTQLVTLAAVTLRLAAIRGLEEQQLTQLVAQLQTASSAIQGVIEQQQTIVAVAQELANKPHVLFLGRGSQYPVALEGALKLKEISYIHAEAYAAGELKHGPLALVDDELPVVAICPDDHLMQKLQSNLSEVKARGGQLYVLSESKQLIDDAANYTCLGNQYSGEFTSPLVMTVSLQLLAYHAANYLGTDIDQPRNLAKSVTVQ